MSPRDAVGRSKSRARAGPTASPQERESLVTVVGRDGRTHRLALFVKAVFVSPFEDARAPQMLMIH
jgi:hypothetical protein